MQDTKKKGKGLEKKLERHSSVVEKPDKETLA